jgi:hypothetical protein
MFVGILGTHYIVFCWYLWGILYIVSIGIFGTCYVVFLLVFLGHTI